MKRVGICVWMMIKRMGRHPVYWLLLLLFPTALFVVPKWNKAVDEEQISVGYVMEETGKRTYGGQLPEQIEYKLQEGAEQAVGSSEQAEEKEGNAAGPAGREKLFKYIKYTGVGELKEGILTGEVSCGVVFDEDFAKRLAEQDYRHCITLYLPEGMNVGGMVQEDVFARVYQAYSAVWYAELLGQRGYQMTPEEVLQKFSEYQKDGKVFAVEYEEYGKADEEVQNEAGSGKDVSAVLSLRNVFAFLTFLSASLGALDRSRDRKRGAGKGICCKNILAAATVGAPVLPPTLLLAGGMVYTAIKTGGMLYADRAAELADNMSNGLMRKIILPELCSAFVYGLVLWLLAMLFSRVIPEKLLEGIMPCFLLIAVLCCPVFFDLGESIPLAGSIARLFPVTWYLKFWG